MVKDPFPTLDEGIRRSFLGNRESRGVCARVGSLGWVRMACWEICRWIEMRGGGMRVALRWRWHTEEKWRGMSGSWRTMGL